jgi:hypothetical protein
VATAKLMVSRAVPARNLFIDVFIDVCILSAYLRGITMQTLRTLQTCNLTTQIIAYKKLLGGWNSLRSNGENQLITFSRVNILKTARREKKQWL